MMALWAFVLALASLLSVRAQEAQEPTFAQKDAYLKSTVGNMVPTDAAPLDCLVPEADRASFMERVNKEANQATDGIKQADLFGKNVNFDRFVKGVLEAKGQKYTDVKEFNAAVLKEKLIQRQKLPKDGTEMSCLVAPADRTSFVDQIQKFADNKQVVSVDSLAAEPSPSFDKFITDMVTTMSYDQVASALQNDAKKAIEQAPAVDEATEATEEKLNSALANVDKLTTSVASKAPNVRVAAENTASAANDEAVALAEKSMNAVEANVESADSALEVALEGKDIEKTCHDASANDADDECYKNTLWAKNVGISANNDFYKDYPFLKAASSFDDFQYVLHRLQVTDGTGHNCPMPCSLSDEMQSKADADAKEAAQKVADQVNNLDAAVSTEAKDVAAEESNVAAEATKLEEAATKRANSVAPPPELEAAKKEAAEDAHAAIEAVGGVQDSAIVDTTNAIANLQGLGQEMDDKKAVQTQAALAKAKEAQEEAKQVLEGADAATQPALQKAAAKSAAASTALQQAATDMGAVTQEAAKDTLGLGSKATSAIQDAAEFQKKDSAALENIINAGAAPPPPPAPPAAASPAAPAAPPAFTANLFTVTEAPSGGWGWMKWAMIVLAVCCCLPLLGLACSMFMCYESVAWMFGGSEKRSPQKKKKRAVGALRAAAPPPPPAMEVARPEMAPLIMPQALQSPMLVQTTPVQQMVVPTTVTQTPVYTYAAAEQRYTNAGPATTYAAAAPATTYVTAPAPAPATYVTAPQFAVAPAPVASYARPGL